MLNTQEFPGFMIIQIKSRKNKKRGKKESMKLNMQNYFQGILLKESLVNQKINLKFREIKFPKFTNLMFDIEKFNS